MSLEEVVKGREETRTLLKRTLFPVRKVLELNPFLGGKSASFSDYTMFGAFMWARITSSFDILEEDDPIADWRERMLDLFSGLARKENARNLDPDLVEDIRQRRVPKFNTVAEKIIYEFATQLHRDHRVNDETYAAAVREFGEEGTVDLVGILGYYTLISMTLNAFNVPLPEGENSELD